MLKDMPGLASLKLWICEDVTETGLKEFKHLSGLTSLEMYDTLQLSHKGCGPARAQESDDPQSLTSLKLGGCDRLTDEGLKELRRMSGLTSLNLRFCKSITDAGLKELRHMSGLTSLNLAGCWNFTDEGLKELRLMYRPVVRYVRQKWCSSGHFGAVFGTDFGEIAISPSVRI